MRLASLCWPGARRPDRIYFKPWAGAPGYRCDCGMPYVREWRHVLVRWQDFNAGCMMSITKKVECAAGHQHEEPFGETRYYPHDHPFGTTGEIHVLNDYEDLLRDTTTGESHAPGTLYITPRDG